MPSPADLKYTKEHEWVRIDGDPAAGSGGASGTIGITDYAQDQLGDIVFVELPEVGATVSYMEKFGEIESVKAVSELFSPISGEVTQVNTALADNPQAVNESPYDEGWMLRIRLTSPREIEALLTADQYDDFIVSEPA
jgi:glycine cleavage system H protein